LDVGGGVGLYYPFIKRYCKLDTFQLLYTVVDSLSNIEYGRKFFAQEKNINFILPDQLNTETCIPDATIITIINISATLQYILKWRDYLAWLIQEFNPRSIVISRFPVCNSTEYEGFAIQDVTTTFGYCGATKVVLFKSGDLENFMDCYGYTKCSEALCHKPSYFTGGVSDSKFKEISIMAYNFVK